MALHALQIIILKLSVQLLIAKISGKIPILNLIYFEVKVKIKKSNYMTVSESESEEYFVIFL
jgi:hypothetical protein